MNGDYLVTASNMMFGILSKSIQPSPNDLKEAFIVGCNALKRLREDGAFLTAVQMLAKRKGTVEQDVAKIINDIEHFTSGFLVIEGTVMVSAGINEVTWGRLSQAAKEVRADAAQVSLNENDLRNVVNELQVATCKIAHELERAEKGSLKWKRAGKILVKVTLGIGGATMVFVNAGALAASLGLSTAGSAASATVGATLLTKSVEGGWK